MDKCGPGYQILNKDDVLIEEVQKTKRNEKVLYYKMLKSKMY